MILEKNMKNKNIEIDSYLTELIKKHTSTGNIESFDSLDLDSLSLVSVIVDIETTFDFEFDDEDMNLDNFATLNSIKKLILKRLEDKHEKRITY